MKRPVSFPHDDAVADAASPVWVELKDGRADAVNETTCELIWVEVPMEECP